MDEIKVSVIVPVYNAEKDLGRCLDSILSQSLSPIEVICVDDGSSDGSLALLERYAADDPRVRVLAQQNQYAGAARNRGMEAARGTWLAFMDADDSMLPGSLEAMWSAAERDGADMVKAGFLYWDAAAGREYTDDYSALECMSARQLGRVLSLRRLPVRLLQVPDVPWNGLYRRAFVEEHGLRFNSLKCVNDHSFYIACLLEAERIRVLRLPVVRYRISQPGSLVGNRASHFENQLESYRIVRGLCRGRDAALVKHIMRQELNGALTWYEKLKAQAPDPEGLRGQMAAFLREVDEAEVGQDFLRSFPHRALYFELRYGRPAPRGSVLFRTVQCWREHGLGYTVKRIFNR